MKNRHTDIAAGIFLLVVGIVIWKAGAAVPPSFLDTGFGSGYLPQLVGATITVLSAVFTLQAAFTSGQNTDGEKAPSKPRDYRPLGQLLLFAGLLLTMEWRLLPFYPAAFLFLTASIMLLGEWRWRRVPAVVAFSLAATLLVWVLFTHVFLVIIG